MVLSLASEKLPTVPPEMLMVLPVLKLLPVSKPFSIVPPEISTVLLKVKKPEPTVPPEILTSDEATSSSLTDPASMFSVAPTAVKPSPSSPPDCTASVWPVPRLRNVEAVLII